MVCEAPADRDTACLLADRVLLAEIDWLDAGLLDLHRRWRGLKPAESYLRWGSVSDTATQAGLKGIFGHFAGEAGAHDALAARKALLLLATSQEPPDAVMLIRDSDTDSNRRKGLEQARDDRSWPFEVVIGVAEPKRECWVLAGFDARGNEVETLRAVEQRLSFHPVRDAHRLTAREHGAKNDAKKALDELTSGNSERELECLRETPLETLQSRGEQVRLTRFLAEVRERLVPVVGGSKRSG
ncbi:hypothetical protein D7V97_22025 [Corallococcus sp. CA053C]|nr:hypothetical protein D7V97_22025 [Corallococcus sp. CA053C]